MQKKQHANLCERLYYEIISNFGRQQLCDREATFPVGRTMKCYILTSLALRYVGVAICTRSFNLVSLYSVRVLVVYVRAQRHYLLLSTPKCVKVVRHTLSWYDGMMYRYQEGVPVAYHISRKLGKSGRCNSTYLCYNKTRTKGNTARGNWS